MRTTLIGRVGVGPRLRSFDRRRCLREHVPHTVDWANNTDCGWAMLSARALCAALLPMAPLLDRRVDHLLEVRFVWAKDAGRTGEQPVLGLPEYGIDRKALQCLNAHDQLLNE